MTGSSCRLRTALHTLALLLMIFGTLPAAPAAAQDTSPFTGGIGLILGFPQGEFRDHVPNIGFGGSGNIGVRVAGSPLVLGLDLGYMIYGHEARTEPFSMTIPDVTVRVSTNNNIFLGHLMARLQPPEGSVRPYLDGLFGFKYFWTETTIRSLDWSDDEDPIASSTNLDDFALSYGGRIGLAIEVYDGTERRRQKGEGIGKVLLDLRLGYLLGSEADYLKKGSIGRLPDGTVTYDIDRSLTDFLNFFLGVSFSF
jgi:hypothetical protein